MKKRFEMITKYFLSALTCLVIVSIFFALYGLFQVSILDKGYASYFGYALFEVESGSMSPTINAKDMVIVKETNKIKQDDIITYELENNFITHRVIEIKENKVVAKGDYNNYEDKTIPKDCIIGKVVLRIPKFGIWKEIALSPIVLITIFFTMLLFGLGFSYEDKKLAGKKRMGYTFKDETFDDNSDNKKFKKLKKVLNIINVKTKKFEIKEEVQSDNTDTKSKELEESKVEEIVDSEKMELITVIGRCKWVDDNNRDGIRPAYITVKLMNKDEVIATKEVSSDACEFVFEKLEKREYTIDSNMVSGYKKDILGYDIINTHNPKKMNVTGEILWIDENNKNNLRPDFVNVKLMNGDKVVSDKKISQGNKWKYTFIDLYKYENGKEIEYKIDEEEVKEYKKSISGYNITNTYTSSDK